MDTTQMSDTKTAECEADCSSFNQAENDFIADVEHGKTGTARLINADLVDSTEVPSVYQNSHQNLVDKYLLFEAKLRQTEDNITVVCPAECDGRSISIAETWADTDDISGLAGKRVPIRHIENDVYRIESFSFTSDGSSLSLLPPRVIKWLSDHNGLSFRQGSWGTVTGLKFLMTTFFVLPFVLFIVAGVQVGGSAGTILYILGCGMYVLFINMQEMD